MGASTLKKTRALNVWGQTKKSVEGLVAEGKVAIKKNQSTYRASLVVGHYVSI